MLRAVFAIAITLLPLYALAQSYRCVGTDGKKYYGSSVPPQCTGQPVEQLNERGMVIKHIDAATTAGERAKKDADEADRKKREALAKEQGRKDTALLASYTSEKDIESARGRALEGNQRAAKDLEDRIAALKKRRGAPNEDVKAIDADLKMQEGALAAKKKDIDAIGAKYDEDRRRFVEISKRGRQP
jgi:chromosome segregation ATPase